MADRRTYLVDTSALNRGRLPDVRARLDPLLETDRLSTCAIVRLEVLYSARNAADYDATSTDLAGFLDVAITPDTFERALEVQRTLARTGHHRLPVSDLVIAAAAESASHVVLHYDADFEHIAHVTGQAHEWVRPRGSL